MATTQPPIRRSWTSEPRMSLTTPRDRRRPVVRAAEIALEVILIATASITGLVVIGRNRAPGALCRAQPCQNPSRRSSHAPVVLRLAERGSEPRAIGAPRRSLAELEAIAAEHGYDMISQDSEG
jgi:hypothetical protein